MYSSSTNYAALTKLINGKENTHFVVVGAQGWLGSKICNIIESFPGVTVTKTEARMENREIIKKEIKQATILKPMTHLIIAAGVTHGKKEQDLKNIDFCEDNQTCTIRSNVLGTLSLVDLLYTSFPRTHVTIFGTGCIYDYDNKISSCTHDEVNKFKGFTEEDAANYTKSFYSKTKTILEELLRSYIKEGMEILVLRIRMPIQELNENDINKRCLITKLKTYEKIINVQNSVSVLWDLLPAAVGLAISGETGLMNFTNPGTVSHNEILQLYREYMDKSFKWKNFTIEEQDMILKTTRCNNKLCVQKMMNALKRLNMVVPQANEALKKLFHRGHTKCKDRSETYWIHAANKENTSLNSGN
eukprot:snap_masked-scaffold_9-processed-gene-0.10-mRNA-1 protein AED:0.31 eAED:0.32 QI:0/-1/0/1/-1/1/1/0/358